MRGEFVDLGMARLYYYAAGTRGVGEPILLLHGFPTSSHLWSGVVPRLPSGHRVIVPDLLGFGRSELPRPGHIDSDLTVSGHATRIGQLLDALHVDQACIAGHGMGAAVALAIAVSQPRRVSRLCLVNAVTAASWPSRAAATARGIMSLAPVLPSSWLVECVRRALRLRSAEAAELTRSSDHYLRHFRGPAGRATLLAHLRALTPRANFPPVPTALASPVAVVWGDRDPMLSADMGHALAAHYPGSTLDVVAGGHYAPEESPEQVAAVVTRLLGDGG